MAQTNDKYALYYPTLSDTPNIPSHFQALAEDVAAELAKIEASIVGQDTNTTYTVSSEAVTGGARINLIPSSGTTDFIDIKAGNSNLTITATSDSLITISTDDDSPVYTAGTGLDLATNEFSVNLSELSVNLGTTSVNLGRVSGSLTLNGVSIDGSAGSATTATNLVGTTVNSIPYQSASGTTSYITPSGTNTYLKWTGSVYEWATVSSGSTALSGLTDVDLTGSNSPDNGEVLIYNSTLSKWVAGTVSGGSGAASLDGLSDVAISSGNLNTGSILRYDATSSNFINTAQTLTLSGNTTIGSSTHTVAFTTSANTSVALPTSGTLAINPTTTIGDVIYASATATPGTLARLAGNTATQPAFLTSTGNGTANTTTSFTSSTGTGNVVLATSPSISTSIVTGSTSFDLLNTTVSTINAFGAATTVTIGADTGNVNFRDNISAEGYITARRAATQDSIRMLGRAGGTSTYDVILTPTTLTASRTATFPDATGTVITTGNLTDITTITSPALTLSTVSSTTDGRLSWDATYNHANVGDGANTMLVPTFRVNTTARTAAYTLAATDANTLVQMNGAFAFTVPLSSGAQGVNYPIGTQIHLVALTTGVSVTQAVGVTVNATPGKNFRAAYSAATLIKIDTDTWLLLGDLSA